MRPCRICDAHGVEISRVVTCDTQTGEVGRFALNDNGTPYVEYSDDGQPLRVKFVIDRFDPPLTLVPFRRGEP